MLLVVAGILAFLLFGRERHGAAAPEARHAPVPVSSGPSSHTPTVPVVLIGADCQTLGALGQTAAGVKAFCARLDPTDDPEWSLVSDPTLSSSVKPSPGDEVYPPDIEEQVELCVQQTGQSRARCRIDVAKGNIYGNP
jgi:serine/threonine-protein kinase